MTLKRKGLEGIWTMLIFVVTISIALTITAFLFITGNRSVDSGQIKSVFLGTSTSIGDLVDAKILDSSFPTLPSDVVTKVTQSAGGVKKFEVLGTLSNSSWSLVFNTWTLQDIEKRYFDLSGNPNETFDGNPIILGTSWMDNNPSDGSISIYYRLNN